AKTIGRVRQAGGSFDGRGAADCNPWVPASDFNVRSSCYLSFHIHRDVYPGNRLIGSLSEEIFGLGPGGRWSETANGGELQANADDSAAPEASPPRRRIAEPAMADFAFKRDAVGANRLIGDVAEQPLITELGDQIDFFGFDRRDVQILQFSKLFRTQPVF